MPKKFRYYLLAIFLLSVGSLPVAVLLLKTTSIGLMIASIPLFYMVYSISYSGFSYISGKLSDTVGTTKIIVIGYILLILAYIGIGLAQTSWPLAFAFIILGIFSAATDATQRAFTGKVVDLSERGTAYGLFNAAVGFGAMVSGIAGGYIWQTWSPAVALAFATVMVIVGLVTLRASVKMS
jgi:MFS family permease